MLSVYYAMAWLSICEGFDLNVFNPRYMQCYNMYNQDNVTPDYNYINILRILHQTVGCNDIITAEGLVYVIFYLLLQFL